MDGQQRLDDEDQVFKLLAKFCSTRRSILKLSLL